jgi:hypothetical protein
MASHGSRGNGRASSCTARAVAEETEALFDESVRGVRGVEKLADALHNSFAGCMIKAAAMWGLSSVRAHVDAYYNCKHPAADILARLTQNHRDWFRAGYLRWLDEPTSRAPATAVVRAAAASEAANRWIGLPQARACFAELRDKLLHLAEEEKLAEAAHAAREPPAREARGAPRAPLWEAPALAPALARAPPVVSTPPRAPAPAAPVAPPRRLRPNNTCENRPTKRARPLTPMLRFLDAPSSARPPEARPGFADDIQRMFELNQMPSVWPDAQGAVALKHWPMAAATMDARMREAGMLALYGTREPGAHPAQGAIQLAAGGFNQIWAGPLTPGARALLGPWLGALVGDERDARVVFRGPLCKSDGVRRDAMLAEVTNVTHAALSGYGLRVAFFSWTREVAHKESREEGLVEVRYRLLSALERAEATVAERVRKLVSTGIIDHNPLQWTARKRGVYFEQLLETVWAYSADRFVHLDATLRNLVDLPSQDPGDLRQRICVIDMDGFVFRRLVGGDAQDYQWLWLHNVLVLSCFLKVAFDDNPEFRRVWWNRIRAAVLDVASRRDATPGPGHAFVAGARWDAAACAAALRGAFEPADEPPWCGNTPEATARTALAYMAHYLVYEPRKELHDRYVRVVRPEANVPRNRRSQAASEAGKWFDQVARRTTLPRMHFWVREARRVPARRLVDAMIEFVDTPQDELVARYMHVVPQSDAHTASDLQRAVTHVLMLPSGPVA